jgi:hypothetical protein
VWRRAGGGLRTPLGPAQVRTVAREIGAGRVVDGSVVGLGQRITLAASIIDVASGAMRRIGPMSGPADSLEALVGRLASALLGATGAASVDVQLRLTDSPVAMRAYLEGIAHYRAGGFAAAAPMFERALALDATFARAALMRMLTGVWGIGVELAGWDATTWRLRDQLSARDRVFLTGFLGERFPAWRSPEAYLADLRRAASLLPESPEAQFWLGDFLFHGSGIDISDNFVSARAQLERAYALEPSYESLLHLVEIALVTSDTVMLRRAWRSFERSDGHGGIAAALGRVVGLVLGDTLLERRSAATRPVEFALVNAATEAALPGDEVARIFVSPGTQPSGWPLPSIMSTAINTGRLTDLLSLRQRTNYPADDVLIAAGLFAGGDSGVASAAAERLAANAARAGPRARCWVALWHQHAGLEWQRDAASLPETAANCAASLGLLASLALRSPDTRARTIALDSAVRWNLANGAGGRLSGFEQLILARAWEMLGEPARALAALRLHLMVPWAPPPLFEACIERIQGRLAAQLGDTASAIRSYRRYLRFRRDADPVFIPQRDSVAAELARLEQRQ